MADDRIVIELIDLRRFPLYKNTERHFFIKGVSGTTDYVAGDYLKELTVRDMTMQTGVYKVKIIAPTDGHFKQYNL